MWRITDRHGVTLEWLDDRQEVYDLMPEAFGWRYLVDDEDVIVAMHDFYGEHIATFEGS